jgi:hypothetical protein
MNKIAAAIATGAAGLALAGSPVTHAGPGDLTDPNCKNYSHAPDGYIADMHRCGFASLKSDDALFTTGQRICWQMRSLNAHGRDVGNITAAIVDATGWSYDTAVNFAAITMADLCPELATSVPPLPTPSVPYPTNFPPGAVNPYPAPVHLPPGYRDGD